ncbi:MAG: DNA repair protein RadA [Candidatus Omnitrophica bacterium]|nr:DNA repair protein RadA [Candidatus Omnitrophota bacterium]
MIKIKSVYTCQKCGYQSAKWLGRCPDCAQWNSLIEEMPLSAAVERGGRGGSGVLPAPLAEIDVSEEKRISSKIAEFDCILGGGLVRGSVVLIGGSPGIGKSTLLLQIADEYSKNGLKVLYVSAEESIKQVKLRADRIDSHGKDLFIVNQTNLNTITNYIKKGPVDVVIIDSVQSLYRPELSSIPGSVSQVKECAGELTCLAKSKNFSLFLVGHITKEGALAGPKILEHMVDTVLYFEGGEHHNYRILRAVKNRFGSTNEVGIFEMTGGGLKEVKNPSDIFVSERPDDISGSIIVPVMEGSRPILVEIQALVSYSGYSQATRRVTGLDYNKVNLLIAVLEKRARLKLANKDIFVNVAGGVKVAEPASDLAVIISVASSLKDIKIKSDTVVFGEVGLGGEVRAVTSPKKRINEARKLGFKRCIIPRGNLKGIPPEKRSIEVKAVSTVSEALKEALSLKG